MVVRKRCLLWDYTNTRDIPHMMRHVNFVDGPLRSVSNWNPWIPPELRSHSPNTPYRPMINIRRELQGNEWKSLLDSNEEIIHHFNEPERSGISPEEAANSWLRQVVPSLKYKNLGPGRARKLVSPSCASDPAGQAWIHKWMALVSAAGQQPDFLGLHWYGTDANECKKYIESFRRRYPHLPIIVSEIASVSRNRDEVVKFAKDICNWMDAQDYVFEYAFFGCMRKMPDEYVSPEARLVDARGNLTELMMTYMMVQPIP